MKKMIFAVSTLFLFAACSSDSSTELSIKSTELSIKNSDQSDGSIKDIVWAEGDADWGEEVVDAGLTSTAKEVKETTGRIECAVDTNNDSNFNVATIVSEQTGSDTVSIDEGSSNQVTITATK
jgi:hypothetical protein